MGQVVVQGVLHANTSMRSVERVRWPELWLVPHEVGFEPLKVAVVNAED